MSGIRLKLFYLIDMRAFSILLISFLTLSACRQTFQPEDLIGAWKVDSTYSYYNGFDYLQTKDGGDWATYWYESNGQMKEIKYGSYQTYLYHFRESDSLSVRPASGGMPSNFQILFLNANRLVLKKSKKPTFPGGKQTRYEIRYLSRTDQPTVEAIPFSDPRK